MLSRMVVTQVKNNSYFVCGLALGLWLALAGLPLEETPAPPPPLVCAVRAAPELAAAVSRGPVLRPRYYSTELGVRARVLAAALVSRPQLAAALNSSVTGLLLFGAAGDTPRAPRAVAFTDTRPMLRPFHTLKYLGDNLLADYDLFLLTPDSTYINEDRLQQLAAGLSVSQDIYMGIPSESNPQYCDLDKGIILSNSVLQLVHQSLDWCVRNSFSPHHHENIGRCVLHAANVTCVSEIQGEQFTSLPLQDLTSPWKALTVSSVTEPEMMYALHAYVSRTRLELARTEQAVLGREVRRCVRRACSSSSSGLGVPLGARHTPAWGPESPHSRWDVPPWLLINSTHTLSPHARAVAINLGSAEKRVIKEMSSWLRHHGADDDPEMLEGAWRWVPPLGLHYRVLFQTKQGLRLLSGWRVVSAARLAPAPHVTEARVVWVWLRGGCEEGGAWVRRHKGLQTDVSVHVEVTSNFTSSCVAHLRSLSGRVRSVSGTDPAVSGAGPSVSPDTVLLQLPCDTDITDEFLNRVRMNVLAGAQWFLPAPLERRGAHSARFRVGDRDVWAAVRRDVDRALSLSPSPSPHPAAALLSHGPRVLHAPEPGMRRMDVAPPKIAV